MKLLPILALLSALTLVAFSQTACGPLAYSQPSIDSTPPPTVELKHDKFRPDADVVQLSASDATLGPQDSPGTLGSSSVAAFDMLLLARPPRDGAVDESVYFSLSHFSSDSWKYLECHPLAFLIDGQPYQVGETEHDGTVGRGYVREYIKFAVPLNLVERMAQARVVEGKLCNTEFKFKSETLRSLRDFVSTVRTGVVPPQPVAPREGALSM